MKNASFVSPWRTGYFRGEPLSIGTSVQFLFDDYVVEDRYGLNRIVGPVVKNESNPIYTGPLKPWDGRGAALHGVVYDPVEAKYKGWYGIYRYQAGFETGHNYSTCYAESVDGITWEKPDLGLYSWGKYKQTNIVLHKEDGTAAFKGGVTLNPDAADPGQRFTALAKMVPPGETVRCIVKLHSADGRKWALAPEPILFRGASDGSYSLVYNPELQCWMLYRRPPTRALKKEGFYAEANNKRHVSVSLSADMEHWSHPRSVALPDENDVSDVDSVSVVRWGNLFLGFIGLMPNNSPDIPKHTQLMWSRDGFAWERLPDRASFIANGAPGEWDQGSISFSGTIVPEKERLRLYYTGVNVCQFEKRLPRITGTGLAYIGRDRWIGQHAGPEGGYLLTRQFVLEGRRLVINCLSQVKQPPAGDMGGLIKAELLQEPAEHNPASAYPGFSLEDCDPIAVSDSLEQVVSWRGSSDLSALRGKPVYIRFFIRNAILYTLQVQP